MMELDKKLIRSHIKDLKATYSSDALFGASVMINQKLFEHDAYKDAKIVGMYVSKETEVDTIQFIEQTLKKKRVAVPKVEGDIMNFYRIKSLSDLTI